MGASFFFSCDGPDCNVVAHEDAPAGDRFVRVQANHPNPLRELTFCSWLCAAFYAGQQAAEQASQPPAEGGGDGA
jgi:hypothetical protein